MRGTATSLELDPANQAEMALLDHEFDEHYGLAFKELDSEKWELAATAHPEIQEKAWQKTAQLIGGMAIRGTVEGFVPPERSNESSLMAATQQAALGDEASLRVVTRNVGTDVAERLFKAGHQTKVDMEFVDGNLEQDGRPLVDIHRNTLEHTVLNDEMMSKTTFELQGVVLAQLLYRAGILTKYNLLLCSPSSTRMTPEEKRRYGMFVDTDSCSIQLLSTNGSQATLETAFVAGKVAPNAPRHDIKAIQALAAAHGITIDTSDGTEMLQHVMLIPKEQAPGVANVVEWFDDAAGGTFYGQDKPRQDYQAYAESCYERSKDFDGMVQDIVAQLVSESHTFMTPMDAVLRLDELSAAASRKRALHDNSIDVAIFGAKAAEQIQEARFFMERGQIDRAEMAMAKAAALDESGTCPLFKGSSSAGGEGGGSSSQEEIGGKKWGHCPYCKALVYVDPCAKRISCWDCTALVVNGKIISTGNGGTRGREGDRVDRIAEFINSFFKQQDVQLSEQEQEAARVEKELVATKQAAAAGGLALGA